MKATMLSLPRELYLEVTGYLEPRDLATLARISKDHYLAVQEPLYSHPFIFSWPKLVILVRALTRAPLVSSLSAKQRVNWHKLSDQQLRERTIRRLHITLDSRKGKDKVTGADLSRMIGAVSRSCHGVNITLTLSGLWYGLLKQLQNFPLPDVAHLIMYLGSHTVEDRRSSSTFSSAFRSAPSTIWDLCFGGSTFPDLRSIEMDTHHPRPADTPPTLLKALENHDLELSSHVVYLDENADFHGLKRMTNIKLSYNHLLNTRALEWLFASSVIPQHLTSVEIVNCPNLDQVRDLAALSMLLKRGLCLLQHLTLHLLPLFFHNLDRKKLDYRNEINENPDHHLCEVVRSMGQQIKSLDLAMPLACGDMFVPVPQTKRDRVEPKTYPHLPRHPMSTLPKRVLAAGYLHRRLIVWNGICFDKHDWREMEQLAADQGERVSLEIVSPMDGRASWHVHGHSPVNYSADEVLSRELEAHER